MTQRQKDQIKERLHWGAMITSITVGLTVLGVVPKCSEIQTTQAAREQHKALRDDLRSAIDELKVSINRSNERLLRYMRANERETQ